MYISRKSVEDTLTLIKTLSKIIENEVEEQRGGFLMSSDILGTCLLGNTFAGKVVELTKK